MSHTIVINIAQGENGEQERCSPYICNGHDGRHNTQCVDDGSSKVVRQGAVNTFKVFTEAIQKASSRDRIVESDMGEENSFQQTYTQSSMVCQLRRKNRIYTLIEHGRCFDGTIV